MKMRGLSIIFVFVALPFLPVQASVTTRVSQNILLRAAKEIINTGVSNAKTILLSDLVASAGAVICPEFVKDKLESTGRIFINKFCPEWTQVGKDDLNNKMFTLLSTVATASVSYGLSSCMGMEQNFLSLFLGAYASCSENADEERLEILSKFVSKESWGEKAQLAGILIGVDFAS